MSSLAIGIPIVAAATLASLTLSPPTPISLRPLALVILAMTFLYGSLRGGWDIARRALSPTLALSPVLIDHVSRLDSAPARKVFASLVTLMPGTLTADIRGRDLRIHALVDRGDDLRRDLMALEGRVARALGVRIDVTEVPDA